VWLVLGEQPSRGAIIGGIIVLSALAVHIRAASRGRSRLPQRRGGGI
jgi:drug/metabolite transporter (DMT)-like permease